MRMLFEVLLLSILVGAIFLFYKIIIGYLYPKNEAGNNSKGFTLIELLIVGAIIAILAAIAIPQFDAYRKKKDPKYRAAQQRENCFNYDVEFPKGTVKAVRSSDIVTVDVTTTGIVLTLVDGSEIRADNYVKKKCF